MINDSTVRYVCKKLEIMHWDMENLLSEALGDKFADEDAEVEWLWRCQWLGDCGLIAPWRVSIGNMDEACPHYDGTTPDAAVAYFAAEGLELFKQRFAKQEKST